MQHLLIPSTVIQQLVTNVCDIENLITYCDHIGWNTWKIISRLIGLRFVLGLTPTWAIWCNGNTPKIRVK